MAACYHLKPTDADMAALMNNGVEPLTDDALKAARKIRQTFKDRRYLVGDMCIMQNPAHWHFLYLDQRDIAETDNHWMEGPHIHFLNWPWQRDPQVLWTAFRAGEAPKGTLHIRFCDDRADENDDKPPEDGLGHARRGALACGIAATTRAA